MSLDITIIDDCGMPCDSVALTIDEHWLLIQQAQRLQLPQWSRMSDYYEDVDYTPEDVSILAQETELVEAALLGNKQIGVMCEIKALLATAIRGRKQVCAIAD